MCATPSTLSDFLPHSEKKTNDVSTLKHCADPHWLKVSVVSYDDQPDKDPRVSSALTYALWNGATRPTMGTPPIKRWDVVQDWLQVASFGHDANLIMLVAKLKHGLKFGFKIEDLLQAGPQQRKLPFLAGSLPSDPAGRLLAFLD